LLEAVTKALIRDIKKWNKVGLLDNLSDFTPLIRGQVHACRVVAASMEHDYTLCGQRAQCVEHALKVKSVCVGIVIGRVDHLETGALEQRTMVFPTRVADRDFCARY
jgi:hypothetical protein